MSKWTNTSVTRNLGIAYPIIQGPFGRGGSTAQLAGTISNLGGLGSFGANELSPEDILKVAAEIRKLTHKPFGMNLWVSTFDTSGDSLNPGNLRPRCRSSCALLSRAWGKPSAKAFGSRAHFNDQVAALIEAAPAVFSFVFGIPSPEILRACRSKGIVTIGGASTVEEAAALEDAGVDMVRRLGVGSWWASHLLSEAL